MELVLIYLKGLNKKLNYNYFQSISLHFFLFFFNFSLLDPDPHIQCGSRSTALPLTTNFVRKSCR